MPGNYTYSLFEGTGGLYRCYVTNAFALSRQLSVGINLGMIAGTVTQSETQESAVVKYESSNRPFRRTSASITNGVRPDNGSGRQGWYLLPPFPSATTIH